MEPERRAGRWALAPLFFSAGGMALAAQVLLLRELMVALQGDEAALALGLAAWLAGIGAGAELARRGRGIRAGWGFGLLAVAGPLEILVLRLGRWLLSPPPGELLSLGPALGLAVAGLLPAGALVGVTFTALAAAAPGAGWRPGKGLAALYILESLGSLASGLLVTFLLIPRLAPLQGSLLAAGIFVLAGCVLLPAGGSTASPAGSLPGPRALPLLGLLLAVAAVPVLSRPLEEASVALRFRGLAPGIPLRAWTETPYQQVAIGGNSTKHLYLGGEYAGSYPDPTVDEQLALEALTLAPRAGKVLLIGAGFVGPLPYLLREARGGVDLVEMDRRALELVRKSIPSADASFFDDARLRIHYDDPRRFLARGGERYSLILILEPPPVTLLLSRLFTVEFYRLCREHLLADGVLVVRLETAPNVLTGETAFLGGSIWGALSRVFPVVRAGPGPDSLLLAGSDPEAVTLDPDVLARRFRARGVVSQVLVPELFPLLFPRERVAGQERALRNAASTVAPSRDERPVCFLHALARRQQIAGSLLAPLLGRASRASPWRLGALALLPSLLILAGVALRRDAGRSASLAATHAVTVTGACGMAWSLLVLFSYQTRVGALYGRLGALTALFMLGLAAGALLLARSAELPAARARRRLATVTAAAFVFALAVPGVLLRMEKLPPARLGLQELAHAALLLAAGAVTGGVFPAAAGVLLSGARGVREAAGRLEAADHWGAAAAALVAGLVVIPALGLAGAAWLLAALEATALAGAILVNRRRIGSP